MAKESRTPMVYFKDTCKWGHPLSGANLHVKPNGNRRCLTCHREQKARYAAIKRGEPVEVRPDPKAVEATEQESGVTKGRCGHPIEEFTAKHGCRVCHRSKNNTYMQEYRKKQRHGYVMQDKDGGSSDYINNAGRASGTAAKRRASAKRVKQAVFWKRSTGLSLMGLLLEDLGEKVLVKNLYGIESRLPKVDGWLLVLPAAEVPGLPGLPAAA